jgi:hypothetical protein
MFRRTDVNKWEQIYGRVRAKEGECERGDTSYGRRRRRSRFRQIDTLLAAGAHLKRPRSSGQSLTPSAFATATMCLSSLRD